MSFEDKILLRLRRKYAKDEELALILKKLSETQLELGMVKAELSEARDTVIDLQKKLKALPKPKDKDEFILELQATISKKHKKCNLISQQLEEWRNKALSLQIQLEKLMNT